MTARVFALRPEPGLAATLSLARELGIRADGAPLFEVRARAWQPPEPAEIDALLVGSANAFKHGGAALSRFTGKPVHAVGARTAQAGRAMGFEIATVGSGGLQNVLDAIEGPRRLLRIAGAKHVPLDVPDNIAITTVIAYESAPLPMPPAFASGLVDGKNGNAIVLLHSAEAAGHFAHECDRLGIARGSLVLAVLGPRIAENAGSGWRAVHVAPQPDDRALLETVRDIAT